MNIVLSCIVVIVVVYTYLDLDNRQRHETHRGKWIDVIDCSIDNNGNTTQECNIRPPHFGAGHSYEGPRDQRVESETQEGELGKKQVYKSESILKKGYTWNRFNRYLKKTRDRIFQIAPKASAKTNEWNDRTRAKARYMRKNGMTKTLSTHIIDTCKEWERAQRCVALATHVFIHESGRWKSRASKKYKNPFWLMQKWQHMRFNTRELASDRRMKTYKSYWYKNTCTTMVTRSKYTTTQKPERIKNCYSTTKRINKVK